MRRIPLLTTETEKHRSCLHMNVAKQILKTTLKKTTKIIIEGIYSKFL